MIVYLVAVWAHLEFCGRCSRDSRRIRPFALIVMFQSEIRRSARQDRTRPLARAGRPTGAPRNRRRNPAGRATDGGRETGALIVMERDIGLRTFIESGVALDAVVSRDLLLRDFRRRAARCTTAR